VSAPEPALRPVNLTVVGSINVDYTLKLERLPRPGETVTANGFLRAPGGKGANQAVAAARLGADVTMVGAVGEDTLADEALVGLREAGVRLELERSGETGIAMIYVDAEGQNEIAVFAGANGELTPREVEGFVLCQLEIPDEVVLAAAKSASFFVLNASPAREIDFEPNLLIVNELEYETCSRGKLVAVTYGKDGAALVKDGKEIARAEAPTIEARDATGAGDAFAAALTYTLLGGVPPENALRFACTAGAWVAAQMGAQLSMPTMEDVFLWM
jgi:ribokinase